MGKPILESLTLENVLAQQSYLVPPLCLPPSRCKFRSKSDWNALGGRTTEEKRIVLIRNTL